MLMIVKTCVTWKFQYLDLSKCFHAEQARNGWKAWQQQQMLKGWRKKEVQRAIFLRDSDPANQGIDFTRVEELWDRCGVIYGLYHFTSGRWYVGQTKKRAWARFQEHWYSRKRLPDLLHEALALEQDPFCVTLIPLEFIDQHIWLQSTTAQEQTRLFRNAATPREQYWTDKLQSMWPKGWNAAWPGQPAPKRAKRAPQRVLHIDPSDAQELYQGLVDGIGSNAQETLDKIRNLEFSTARKIVQWKMKQGTRVQSCSRPGEAEVEAALRQRVKDKPRSAVGNLLNSYMVAMMHGTDTFAMCFGMVRSTVFTLSRT